MNMISEQANILKAEAEWLEQDQEKRLASILLQAADVIESLSAKLQAANMERSEDCGEVGNGKSFLLIDTPKSCVKCPLKSQMYDNQYICQGNHRRMVIPSNKNKPDWCPLRESADCGGWIPCSERLPEKDIDVLIRYYNSKEGKFLTDIAWIDEEGDWQLTREKAGYFPPNFKKEITKWMPLPGE